MTDWLDYPLQLDQNQTAEVKEKILDLVAKQQGKDLAAVLKTLHEDFIEWSSKGCYVYTADGTAYFDAATAGGVFGLGHSNPKVIESVEKQLKRGGLSVRCGQVPLKMELIDRLAKITPEGLDYGLIGSSGTEVIECAIKLARLTTGRSELIGTVSGYHGMSIGTLSVSGLPFWQNGIEPLLDSCHVIPYDNLEAAKNAITENTAAFILEPVQWASGCKVAGTEYLQGLREHCDKTGTLLIFDEIQSGLGRTGKMFACQHAQVTPDLLAIGKTLSGGIMPIAALMFNERVNQKDLTKPFFNNSTFAGNPLASSAAIAALDIIEKENIIDNVNKLSFILRKRLNRMCLLHSSCLNFHRGIGLMRCIYTKTPKQGFVLSHLLMNKYRMILPAMLHTLNVLRISPPLNATVEELDYMLNTLSQACQDVENMGQKGVDEYVDKLFSKANQEKENTKLAGE